MPLDFSLLGNGVQFGNVLASYEAGAEKAKADASQNALALYATDPEKGIAQMRRVDPTVAMKLQSDYTTQRQADVRKRVVQGFDADPAASRKIAVDSGDPEAIAAWSALDKPAREQAHEKAKAIGTAAYGILRSAPGQTPEDTAKRQALVKQVAPLWVANGLPQAEIDAVIANPTPEALEQFILGSDAVLKLKIDDENQRRDDDRAAARDAEMATYRGQMAGAAQTRAGAAVTSANRPRATGGSGGGAAPRAPVRVYSPQEVKFD